MPIDLLHLDNGAIVVVNFQSQHRVQDLIELIDTELIPYVRQSAPQLIHLIFDWQQVDWSFSDLMTYINSTVERRKNNPPPMNAQYHFVGVKAWINSWRSYMLKNYGLETGAFQNVDEALNYIRALEK